MKIYEAKIIIISHINLEIDIIKGCLPLYLYKVSVEQKLLFGFLKHKKLKQQKEP
jgi:hypothetical protein